MKIALLSDAHGNPEGLSVCLDAITRLDAKRIFFLGDSLGYLTGECAVLDLLEAREVICQKGNCEAILLGELSADTEVRDLLGLEEVKQRMTPDRLELLRSWPETRDLKIDGRRILLSHGSPSPSLTEYVHRDTPLCLPDGFPFDAVFLGHTHRPFVREEGGVLLVNVGSCGLPRDHGDRAAFAIYDTNAHQARIYRVRFDRDKVLKRFWDGSSQEVRNVLFRDEGSCIGEFLADACEAP